MVEQSGVTDHKLREELLNSLVPQTTTFFFFAKGLFVIKDKAGKICPTFLITNLTFFGGEGGGGFLVIFLTSNFENPMCKYKGIAP